jgi:hypothetical protein
VLTRNPPKPPARISPGQPPARQEPKPLHQAGSWEDKVYTRALELNPYLADLVEKLHLVNPKTGRPYKATRSPRSDFNQATQENLHRIAEKLLQGTTGRTREGMLEGLQSLAPDVTPARAEKGLQMLLDVEAIKEKQGTYTLQE